MKHQLLTKIQEKVRQLLEENKITAAPVNVEAIATSQAIEVRKTPAEDDLSGFLFKQPDGTVVIGVNSLHHPNRQRFTIGHEIGHFVFNHHEQVHVDRLAIKLRDSKSGTGENDEEIIANRFAAELLMPSDFLAHDLPKYASDGLLDDRGLKQIAKQYKVSVQAMTNRLVSLGFISENALT